MGKRSAQARNGVEAGGVRDQSRMAMTRHEVWGNAREPDGGTPGCPGLGNQLFDIFPRIVATFRKLKSKLREEISHRRGHGPERLDVQAALATVTKEGIGEGMTEN